ncbi:hypothetical protein RV16_GL001993 [Enterococcus saccharolyticus]|nr:DUF3459 domain-containing protein [Enterococcus saccharolyticus]OJG89811.1 hypothetical protein RV16_GL001993 [Enterococcus saccharolyticus]
MEEQRHEDSIYHFYKKLIALRKEYPVFIEGAFHYIETNNDDLFCYERKDEHTCFTIVVNLGETEHTCDYLQNIANQAVVLTNYEDVLANTLRPYEARLYQQ